MMFNHTQPYLSAAFQGEQGKSKSVHSTEQSVRRRIEAIINRQLQHE